MKISLLYCLIGILAFVSTSIGDEIKENVIDGSLLVGIWSLHSSEVSEGYFGYTEYKDDGTYRTELHQASKHSDKSPKLTHYGEWNLEGNRLILDGWAIEMGESLRVAAKRKPHTLEREVFNLTRNKLSYRVGDGSLLHEEKVSSIFRFNLTVESDHETWVSISGPKTLSPHKLRKSTYPLPIGEYTITGRKAGYKDVVISFSVDRKNANKNKKIRVLCKESR